MKAVICSQQNRLQIMNGFAWLKSYRRLAFHRTITDVSRQTNRPWLDNETQLLFFFQFNVKSASPMTTETSVDLPVVFLSKQINRIYIAPKSQARRLARLHDLYSERHPLSSDTRYERGETCHVQDGKRRWKDQQTIKHKVLKNKLVFRPRPIYSTSVSEMKDM